MSEKMKAVAIVEKKKVDIIDITKPVSKSDQVLIKIKVCALCTYEQRVYLGVSKMPLPFVGGHEITGEIAQIGREVDAQKIQICFRYCPKVTGKPRCVS